MTGGQDGVGSLADEAQKLLDAAAVWLAERSAGATEKVRALAEELDSGLAVDAPECRYCPLCQLIALLRGERPELTARLVEIGTALLLAVRSTVDTGGDGHAHADSSADPERAARKVQQINVE